MASHHSGHMRNLLGISDPSSLLYIGDESRDDDNSPDSDFHEPNVVKIKRRSVVKRFRQEWMEEPVFAGWLRPLPNKPERCICTACGVILVAGHSELEKHAAGRKHSLALKSAMKGDNTNDGTKPESADAEYGNEIILLPKVTAERKACLPKGTILQRLSEKDKEKITRPIIINSVRRTAPLKRKADSPLVVHRPTQELPENPDVKFIRSIKSDTEDDFDEDEELEYLDEALLPPSHQLLNELKAELTFTENKMIQDKQKQAADSLNPMNGKIDEMLSNEKEMEARLSFIEEKRRHELNIYKLKLVEMETRLKLGEADAARAEEVHQLRTAHLQLLIQKEQAGFVVECTDDNKPEEQYNV